MGDRTQFQKGSHSTRIHVFHSLLISSIARTHANMGKIVHIVLQKLAPSADPSFTAEWAKMGNAMMGKIPGLLEIKLGECIEGSKHKTAGYTHMLYSVFEDESTLRDYATAPPHVELLELGKGKFEDKVVFDLEM